MVIYNVIIAGCGSMAREWADYAAMREDTAIVGLVDIHLEAAHAFAQQKGLNCPVFTNIEEAIQVTGANLVFDITVPASHYHIASTAMQLGCDVFSEKPLAENMSQCVELVQLAQKLGKTHAIMQNRRFDPRIRSLRQMITENRIGTVGFTGADFFLAPHFGGFRDIMDSPLLLDMAIHTFDQARFIMGANPVSVYCHEFNPVGSWYQGNAMAICIFEMSDGSVFNYRGSWCAEGAPTSWEASWRIIGDQGTIIWDGHDQPYAELVPANPDQSNLLYEHQRVESVVIDMPLTFHKGCLDNMFLALSSGIAPETVSSDNLHSMAMVLAAVESAKAGKKIQIADIISQQS